jgi:AmpD protein
MTLSVTDELLPDECCRPGPRLLTVDTIVVHFISALHWHRLTPADHARFVAAGLHLPQVAPDQRKYHPAYCRALLVAARLSYHYLIDRGGRVSRLVPEERVARHAGVSKMPTDGREDVNAFSIGVSLIASHPHDDPEVASGRVPGFAAEQYEALAALIADVQTRHPIRTLVGHDEIAPGRKHDLGEEFDWSRFRKPDYAPL